MNRLPRTAFLLHGLHYFTVVKHYRDLSVWWFAYSTIWYNVIFPYVYNTTILAQLAHTQCITTCIFLKLKFYDYDILWSVGVNTPSRFITQLPQYEKCYGQILIENGKLGHGNENLEKMKEKAKRNIYFCKHSIDGRLVGKRVWEQCNKMFYELWVQCWYCTLIEHCVKCVCHLNMILRLLSVQLFRIYSNCLLFFCSGSTNHTS